MKHSILFIGNPNDLLKEDLKDFSTECGCEIIEDAEVDVSLELVQKKRFDVIVVDAEIQGMHIDRLIHILKEIDPSARIIVKATQNSKSLEAKIRQAKVYYYHLNSFGVADLKLAIQSALGNSQI